MADKIQLNRELIEQIVFGMENQGSAFLLDLEKGMVVEKSLADEGKQETQIPLPDWNPSDGFLLMEKFVTSLNNPLYRDQLLQILHIGKGVFRKFKNLLKTHPQMERLWYNFKQREMQNIIVTWLESYQDYLELSHLGKEPENLQDLILSDFSLIRDSAGLINEAEEWDNLLWEELFPGISESYKRELFRRYRKDNPLRIDENNHLWVYQNSESFTAAFLWFEELPDLILCRSLYTLEEYRGMGLASELLSALRVLAEEKRIPLIEISPVPNHPRLEKLFIQSGFIRQSCGFCWTGNA